VIDASGGREVCDGLSDRRHQQAVRAGDGGLGKGPDAVTDVLGFALFADRGGELVREEDVLAEAMDDCCGLARHDGGWRYLSGAGGGR